MNQSPIYTVVKNKANADRTLRWAGEGPVWIGAGATLELPYEVWSKADRNRRTSLIAEVQEGTTVLSLKVLQADGTYALIPYSVDAIMGSAQKKNVGNPLPKNDDRDLVEEDEKRHTIRTQSEDAKKAAAHYGADPMKPEESPGPRVEGASTNGFQVDQDTDVQGTARKLAEEKAAAAEAKAEQEAAEQAERERLEAEKKAAEQAAAEAEKAAKELSNIEEAIPLVNKEIEKLEQEAATESGEASEASGEAEEGQDTKADGDSAIHKELFEQAIANKQWADALNCLKAAFGDDKVTFSERTVMSMKDWDAIVAKYNLA